MLGSRACLGTRQRHFCWRICSPGSVRRRRSGLPSRWRMKNLTLRRLWRDAYGRPKPSSSWQSGTTYGWATRRAAILAFRSIMTLPVPGYAMMREIDRIPNLEHRSWWHSELGQHLSRHCWCRADREGYLGGLPEIEVCRLRGWDWNTHQRRVELASAAAAAWLNRKQFQSGVPCFP